MCSWTEKPIKGVLLDISGVLYNSGPGGGAIEGSVAAVKKLKAAGIPVRFVTNETQDVRETLVKKLHAFGFSMQADEVFPPAPAVCRLLRERNLRPYLLVHPDLKPEFSEFDTSSPNCVVVGDAAEYFTFEHMNAAFQVLINQENSVLISMGRGKYYRHGSHLQLDLGPFTAALEFACDIKAEVVGKPSKNYFMVALRDLNVSPEHSVMIGDDIVNDIGGAQNAGMRGVLVRTGKFRKSDENHPSVKPDGIVNNLSQAVDIILQEKDKE